MDLTEKWQSGDVSAFEALFQRHQELVFKTAYLMTDDKEEAKDILQEVFITVWKSRSTFNPAKGKFTTWLHRITVNQCLMKRRKKQPVLVSLEEARDWGFDLPDTRDSELPEESLMSKWRYERLAAAIGSLDGKHRPVLILRYFNDLSYDEIVQVMGIPLGTVKSRLNQAIRMLRAQVEGQREEAQVQKSERRRL